MADKDDDQQQSYTALSFTDMLKRCVPGTTLVCPVPLQDHAARDITHEELSRVLLQRVSSFGFRESEDLDIESSVCKIIFDEKDESGKLRDMMCRGIRVTVHRNNYLERKPEHPRTPGRPKGIPLGILQHINRLLDEGCILDWTKFNPEKLVVGKHETPTEPRRRGRPLGSKSKPK